MKKIKQNLIVAVFLLQWLGWVPFAHGNELNADDEINLLLDMNVVCGDVWCEGDYDIYFKSARCFFEEGECHINFSYGSWDDTKNSGEETCIISSQFEDDLFEDPSLRLRMSQDFYWQLNECITDLNM